MKDYVQKPIDRAFRKSRHYSYSRLNYANVPVTDKEKLRKEIDLATVEYLKNNEITHLPNSPNVKGYSVRVKDLREISDTEEFYYLEEQNENNLY